MRTTLLSATKRTLCIAIVSLICVFAFTFLGNQSASALYCDIISYSTTYCSYNNNLEKGDIVPARGGDSSKRDMSKRLELIKILKERKASGMGFSFTNATAPVILLERELSDIEDMDHISMSTRLFLEEMVDMMEGKTHKEQLTVLLNISKSLYSQTSAELRQKGLDKQQIAEVLYYVVLKYIVSAL